jgi:hypothetical protein
MKNSLKKYNNDIVKEYARRLNDDDLHFVGIRLNQRSGGDVGEAVEFMQKNPDIDKYLASATNADAFFDMLDLLDSHIQTEAKKRFVVHEPSKEKRTANAW